MTTIDHDSIQKSHKILAQYKYEKRQVVHGYADRTLYIDLTDSVIREKLVTEEMKRIFTGGRGFGLKLLWDAVQDATKWDDPENELVIAGGPIGGITSYPGSGKLTVVFISPLTGSVMDSNGGGYFGPYLKFAGWDALEVQGKASEEVVIFIDGDTGVVRVETAPDEPVDTHLVNKIFTDYFQEGGNRKSISVISAGQAADHVFICGLNISYYDAKREEVRIKQAARRGGGSVFRNKHIKAIVVKYSELSGDSNGCADLALVRRAGSRINQEITKFDSSQNDMRGAGTPYLVEIMNRFDLLPVENFRYGMHPDAIKISGEVWKQRFDRRGPDGCWYGCTMSCAHGVSGYRLKTGPYQGTVVFVDGPEYETLGALGSNCDIYDPDAILELNFYCDTYGIDTISVGNAIAFIMECYEYGILNQARTGGMVLSWGNWEAAVELLHQMARGEGFGMVVGKGIRWMKDYFIREFGAEPQIVKDIGMEIKGLEISEYLTKESLAQQGGYAMASKGPQHDEAWLIFMELVHKQLPTFEAKAEALFYFPIWRTWFSLHGLCKLPWNDIIPESNKTTKEPAKVPEHVENYTWLHEGVTGIPVTIDDILLQSERVYNFQRLFNLRLGNGTRAFDYPPYRAVGPVTDMEYESRQDRYDTAIIQDHKLDLINLSTAEKKEILRQQRLARYEMLVDKVYERRGWNQNGIPTEETVRRLEIDFPDVIDLVRRNQ